jgi:hypothetical protein
VKPTDSEKLATDQSGEVRGAKLRDASGDSRRQKNWPTATTRDWKDTNCHSSSEQGEPIQADTWSAGSTRWPSRPSEPQYDWEEPRVVADTKSKQGSSRDNGEEPRASSKSEESQSGGGHSGSLRESNGQAESNWVEHLMGLPAGWTDLGSWETE